MAAKKPTKKPAWVVAKEQAKRAASHETVWLFGLHAVRDALLNPARVKLRLIVTQNAAAKLSGAITEARIEPELVDARRFTAPLDPQSVHQGAALEVQPLYCNTPPVHSYHSTVGSHRTMQERNFLFFLKRVLQGLLRVTSILSMCFYSRWKHQGPKTYPNAILND